MRQRRRAPGASSIASQRDAIEARTGLRLEVTRIAVRDLAKPEASAASTASLLTDDADVDRRRRRRRPRGRADRRRRPRPHADPRGAEGRQAGHHRQQGAPGQGRRRAVPGRRERRRRPPLRGGGGRRHPDHATAARVAGGRAHHPCDGHRQRHDQLHPHPHDRGRRVLRRGPRRGAGSSATPRPTRPPTSRATTPGPRRPSSPASRSGQRSWPTTCITRASPGSPRSTSPSPSGMGFVIKLLGRGGAGRRRRHRRAGAPGDGARSTHPLAAVRESFNAVFVEGDVGRRPHVLRPRRRRRPDRQRHPRRRRSTPRSTGARARTPPWATSAAAVLPADRRRRVGLLPQRRGRSTGPACWPRWPACSATTRVSIRSMEQEGLGDEARLIFITHRAREADVQATLRDLAGARRRRPHRLGAPRRRRRELSARP